MIIAIWRQQHNQPERMHRSPKIRGGRSAIAIGRMASFAFHSEK